MPRVLAALVGGALVFGIVVDAAGQSFYGGVRGAVRDADGVVPGVDLTLTNDDTNVSRASVSNALGKYVFTDVVPGPYSLKAILSGYKTFDRRGFVVGTQEFLTIDITLDVGEIQEQVTVTGASPLIQRANASTGEVLDKTALDTLPNLGRNPFLVAKSLPTVVPFGNPRFTRQQDQNSSSILTLGGGLARSNSYLLDGVPIANLLNAPSAIPTIEALAEVKVQVSAYDAEVGRTGGGVFNATARSGTNTVHGSAFYQTRPVWGQANEFFAEREGIPKPTDLYFRLYGGSFGGPVVKNRTFFWTATEGYRSKTTRTRQRFFPTARERAGDFSQTFDGDGNLIMIYDPLTTRQLADGSYERDPFPGNVIPPDRVSPVARNILSYFPLPDVDQSTANGAPNYARTASIVDQADMATIKIEHKLSEQLLFTGTYLFNNTNEPLPLFWGNHNLADPNQDVLHRRVHIVALNNTTVVNPTTVATLRYGWTRYDDNSQLFGQFDLASLGFPASFVQDVTYQAFPQGCIDGSECFGAFPPNNDRWSSWGFSGNVSTLLGRHTLKLGGDFRRGSDDHDAFGDSSGFFGFDKGWTQADPSRPSDTQGSGLASFVLGLPSGGHADVTRPLQIFVRSYSGYVQDDVRLRDDLTLNLGLRYEYEAGLKERENRFTVAFDRDAVSPLAALTGLPLRGGLRYAGVDGAHDYQGDPSKAKFSPRLGAAWTLNPATVLRGGYGLFWAPWNYDYPDSVNYGQIGYSQRTAMVFTDPLEPSPTLDNPFPDGLLQPVGNSLELLTGAGGEIHYVSQNRKSPRIQQFSVDLQHQLTEHTSVSFAYAGSRGDDLKYGGDSDTAININQLPISLAHEVGNALFDEVPNPFHGIPKAGDLSQSPTIARGQLLRPFPQFGNIFERQTTGARLRYHAVTAMVERRVAGGWGGRFHYTWSRRDDDQFNDGNFYSFQASDQPMDSYNLDGGYSRSLKDVPHRVILAPIVELPFGNGKRWATSGLAARLLGGWTFSAIASYESGSPREIFQVDDNSGTFSGVQRPNVTGIDPNTPGSTEERLGHYINPDAYSFAEPFTFGNAPRTDPRIRSPFRTNYDVVFAKDTAVMAQVKGQIRIEFLNLTNAPTFIEGGYGGFGDPGFGTITNQAGFPRLLQLTFRAFW